MATSKIILGTSGFGSSWLKADLETLADTLKSLNINEVDTAAIYPISSPGLAEELLGEVEYGKKEFLIDTKIITSMQGGDNSMSAEAIEYSLSKSLKALKIDKVCFSCPIISIELDETNRDMHSSTFSTVKAQIKSHPFPNKPQQWTPNIEPASLNNSEFATFQQKCWRNGWQLPRRKTSSNPASFKDNTTFSVVRTRLRSSQSFANMALSS